jgi:hypothetical protein
MVTRSDFIREDVELDEEWQPKTRPFSGRVFGNRQGPRGRGPQIPGQALGQLQDAVLAFLRVIFRIALFLGIFVIAIKSLKPHGGIFDFFAWLAVACLLFRQGGWNGLP